MTTLQSPQYHIDRPTGLCALTGIALNPGQPYVATLVETDPAQQPPQPESKKSRQPAATTTAPNLGFQRLDVSLNAWNQGLRPPKLFGYWRSTVPEPNQKKKLFVDDEILLSLFQRLAGADQPDRLAFRFVLGLILMRKKLLRYDGGFKKSAAGLEQEWWRLTPRGQNQSLEMLNPKLDDQQILQVTSQLSEILQAEL